MEGPCAPWAVECCTFDGMSPSCTGIAIDAASHVLWALSGRRFGECEVTLRPCRDEGCNTPRFWETGIPEWGSAWNYPYPALIGGAWFNLGCGGGCANDCSCNTVHQFTLPGPVSRVVEIVIDGVPLPTGSYRLDNARYIVRTDGGEWPWCNDLSINSGVGAWSATVVYGQPVPPLGTLAAGELACELAKACCGSDDCHLPARVTELVRQGVSMRFIDPQEFLEKGRVGLYICDLFISTVNPNGLASRSRVYSPDHRPPRRPVV